MQFRVIIVTDPPTQTHTHLPPNRQDQLQYTAPQLACSVITYKTQNVKRYSCTSNKI